MRIIGHGIDLVSLEKLAQLIENVETDFVERCFTDDERFEIQSGADSMHRFAGVFAAKEAIAKALGTGFDGEISPHEIMIKHLPSGAPEVVLYGTAKQLAMKLGITEWMLSISHEDTMAVSSAIATGPD